MLNRPISRSSKLRILGLIVIVVVCTIPLLLMYPRESDTQKQSREYSEPFESITIVPGQRVGDYTLGMSKDELLENLGEPEGIVYEGEKYTLNNLPKRYNMTFGDIAFEIEDDTVIMIVVWSPLYRFTNGLGVGDPEERIKQAFGNNFHLKERGNDILTYDDEGLKFAIHKKDRTVIGITVGKKISRERSEPEELNTITIVPGLGVGDYTLGMSKDELLKKLGKPKTIMWNGESYTLSNLPKSCNMYFDGIAFEILDDSVKSIVVYGPLYKFANGLGVGDSEEKIMQAFGNNFHLREVAGKAFLTYEDEGVKFEIHEKKRTVMEIIVRKKISRGHEDSSVKPIKSVKKFDGIRSKDLSKLALPSGKGLTATLELNLSSLRHPLCISYDTM